MDVILQLIEKIEQDNLNRRSSLGYFLPLFKSYVRGFEKNKHSVYGKSDFTDKINQVLHSFKFTIQLEHEKIDTDELESAHKLIDLIESFLVLEQLGG